jgi:hypothetical protein
MKPDELKTAYQQLQSLCTQAADALQEHIDQFTESHTNPETGLIYNGADLVAVESDVDLVERLRAAALPVMRAKPEPTQCWKCGDMDAVGRAKCDAPACGMKEQPEPVQKGGAR